MNTNFLIQSPETPVDGTLRAFLSEVINENQFDVVKVATAYATISGVRALLESFQKYGLKQSCWLIGLDDAISQPGAIELLQTLDKAEVRVASYESVNARFHPKFFSFECYGKPKKRLSIIGSSNLTAKALLGNAESIAIIESTCKNDGIIMDKAWEELWGMGCAISENDLKNYKRTYEKARAFYKKYWTVISKQKRGKKIKEILDSDEAEIDPSIARTCWIECGNITAMGRELEFKAEQGLFFGLNPSGERSKVLKFQVSNGSVVELRMKYQGNHMWRLQMNNDVPEVKKGLRPKKKNGKLGRSPFVAVFKKNDRSEIFNLDFIKIHSRKFVTLKDKTIKMGTFGKTTARQYGWC